MFSTINPNEVIYTITIQDIIDTLGKESVNLTQEQLNALKYIIEREIKDRYALSHFIANVNLKTTCVNCNQAGVFKNNKLVCPECKHTILYPSLNY